MFFILGKAIRKQNFFLMVLLNLGFVIRAKKTIFSFAVCSLNMSKKEMIFFDEERQNVIFQLL
jgi:hypothetical protein